MRRKATGLGDSQRAGCVTRQVRATSFCACEPRWLSNHCRRFPLPHANCPGRYRTTKRGFSMIFLGFFWILSRSPNVSERRRKSTESGTAGTRTQDQSLKRALLYQLSYRPDQARMIAEVRCQITGNSFNDNASDRVSVRPQNRRRAIGRNRTFRRQPHPAPPDNTTRSC